MKRYEMTTDIPERITTPDEVPTSIGKLEFFDGVPGRATVEKVYDYMDRARAVQAYVSTVPGVSQHAMRAGQRALGATGANQILIWDQLADSKPLFLTGNTSTLYAWTYLNLAEDGPTVVDLPPGMLGALDDMWFRYVVDLGVAGPDQGVASRFDVVCGGRSAVVRSPGEVPAAVAKRDRCCRMGGATNDVAEPDPTPVTAKFRRSDPGWTSRMCTTGLNPAVTMAEFTLCLAGFRKDRIIPLGERAGAWVEKYLADSRPELVLGSDDGHRFLTTAGESFTPKRLTQLVHAYVNAADIHKTGSCHLFRHTMATLMLEGGADIRYIQAMLGHVSLETTQIYTRVSIRKLTQIHSATHPGTTLKRRAVQDESTDNKTDIGDSDKTAEPDPTEADLRSALAADAAEETEDIVGSRATP